MQYVIVGIDGWIAGLSGHDFLPNHLRAFPTLATVHQAPSPSSVSASGPPLESDFPASKTPSFGAAWLLVLGSHPQGVVVAI